MIQLRQRISNFSTVRALQAFQLIRFTGFFLTGILLAKSQAGTATIGLYETLMFVSAATGFFWVSGVLNSLLSTYSVTAEEKKGRLLYHALVLLIIFNVALVLILKLFQEQVLWLTGVGIRPYFNQLLLFILFNNPAFLAEYVLLLQGKKSTLLTYGFLVFSISLFVTIIPFYTGGSLHDGFQALIVLAVIKLIYSVYLLRSTEFTFHEMSGLRKQFFFAAPLISGLLISGSAEYIDGFLVTSHFGAESFAMFRYGAREFPISLLMANALSMAMVPMIAANPGEGMAELRREGRKLMHWFFIPVALLIVFSNKIYPLLFREEFIASAPIFNIYLLLLISRMIFPQTVVMALQENKMLFRIAIVELVANVFFSVLLLKLIGMNGVAYGTVLAFMIEKLLLTLYLRRHQKIDPGVYTDLRTWILYSVLLLGCYGTSLL